jgi:hypothetical protein
VNAGMKKVSAERTSIFNISDREREESLSVSERNERSERGGREFAVTDCKQIIRHEHAETVFI